MTSNDQRILYNSQRWTIWWQITTICHNYVICSVQICFNSIFSISWNDLPIKFIMEVLNTINKNTHTTRASVCSDLYFVPVKPLPCVIIKFNSALVLQMCLTSANNVSINFSNNLTTKVLIGFRPAVDIPWNTSQVWGLGVGLRVWRRNWQWGVTPWLDSSLISFYKRGMFMYCALLWTEVWRRLLTMAMRWQSLLCLYY